MMLKIFVLLALVQLALSDPATCPDPSKAKQLVHQERVHVEAPLFGRTQKTIIVPAGQVSCIVLTEVASEGPGASISSIGYSEEGITVNLVSKIKQGIDVEFEAYSE